MSWIEIKAGFTSGQDLSPYIDIFGDFGIENTLEEGEFLTGCLVDVDGSKERIDDLMAALSGAGATSIVTRDLVEENWDLAWRQFFKPRRIGKRFVVRPTWEEFESSSEDLVIVLDPGQAFGTGDHPTTRLCLEMLERVEVTSRWVLDIGCGSGILSIGASLLGAARVLAVDIDPIAIEVAKANADINSISIEYGLPEDWAATEAKFDVAISNIISATLIRLAPSVRGVLKSPATWIVSGVIEANWPDVLAAAQWAGFNLVETCEEDGWVAARFAC